LPSGSSGPPSGPLVEELVFEGAVVRLRVVADAGHDARAFSLSVLAVEGLAKAWIANIGIHYSDVQGVESEVRKLLRGHHMDKLDASLGLERIVPMLAGIERDAMARDLDGVLSQDLFAKKNAGMYVDLRGDEVLSPERLGPDDVVLGKKLRKMVVAWGVILELSLQRDLYEMGQSSGVHTDYESADLIPGWTPPSQRSSVGCQLPHQSRAVPSSDEQGGRAMLV
jgi:AbiV family abortive infection protein